MEEIGLKGRQIFLFDLNRLKTVQFHVFSPHSCKHKEIKKYRQVLRHFHLQFYTIVFVISATMISERFVIPIDETIFEAFMLTRPRLVYPFTGPMMMVMVLMAASQPII